MLQLTKTSYGFKAVANGSLTVAELSNALVKFRRLQPVATSFGYISDQRTLAAMSAEVQVKIHEVMGLFRRSGLARVAIICSSAAVARQSNARLAGTLAADFSMAFDGLDPHWRSKAIDWVTNGMQVERAA